MNNIKIVFLAICSCFIALAACESDKEKTAGHHRMIETKVRSYGTLVEMMHEGNVEAKVSIDTLNKDHLYGLGALAGLKGELIIINGNSYQVTVDDSVAKISNGDSARAALFVYARVPTWDTISVQGIDDVDALLGKEIAKRQNVASLPFQILATPQHLKYHVINFSGEKPTKRNHKEGALADALTNESVHILGFYAVNAEGIYTHHGSKTHMHFMSISGNVSGHVDSLNIAEVPIKILIPSL